MSEQFEEYEITGSVGKYPKEAFTGIFKGYEYTENANGTKELKLLFDEDTIVTIYGRGKLSDDGRASGGLALWINSLAALNIKSFAARDGNELVGLRHEPAIWNAKISIEPDIKKTVGDAAQTRAEVWWGIAKHVILDTPTGKPGKAILGTRPPKAAASKPQVNKDLIALLQNQETQDNLLEAGYDLTTANTPDEINKVCAYLFTAFKQKYKIKELRDAIMVILKAEI